MGPNKGSFRARIRIPRAGFTLLEVMVSLAILATAFTAVLRLHSDSMRMVISSRAHARAVELAQYKMTEIQVLGPSAMSFQSGDFGDLAPQYDWRVDTEPTPLNQWIRVTVTVTNRAIPKGGAFSLTSYMLIE
jgi:type II secretion system protein I